MKVAKKVGIAFGVIFGLVLLAIVILPFVVDVDKYRPQIQSAANEHINGKLELGKLSLNLWGQIRVQVAGLTLSDAKDRKVVGAKDVYFQIPVFSIFTGSPVLKFVLISPEVHVVKDKAGKMNAMTLVKTSPSAPPAEAAKAPPADSPKSLPAIATRARLGVEVKDANFSYRDDATALVSEIKGLNLIVRDLSLSRPMEAEMWANLDTKMGKTMAVTGPLRFKANVDSKFSGSEWAGSLATLSASMDDVEILFGELFHKKKGIPANAQIVARVSPDEAKLENSKIRFHNAEVTLVGGASGLKSDAVKLDVGIESNEIALKPWSELVPMLATYDLSGSAKLQGKAWGTTDKPQYSGMLQAKEVSAKAPNLKAQPKIEALVKVVTDKVEAMNLSMTAPGTDLRVTGKVASFTAPNIEMDVKSTQMDLDQWVEFPKTPAKKEEPAKPSKAESKKGEATKEAPASAAAQDDMDKMLDPLRENKVALATKANVNFNIGLLKAKNVKMTNMNGRMSFKDLVFAVDSFSMGLFGGLVKGTANVAMKPKTPTYRFTTEVAKLDLKTAVESQFDAFKNTLLGQASFKMEGNGSSFNPEPAKKNINAKGNMRVENAEFATIDIGRVASEAVNKAIASYSDKIAALKGKTVPPPPNKNTQYEAVTASFTLGNGKFHAPDFFAKVKPNTGVDIKGDTQVGIVDMSLNANWEIIDTYNVTKARDISVNQQGVQIDHIFAEGNNPVRFPIQVTGSCLAPNINYGSVPEALGKVAMGNIGKAVEAKAKAEISKKVEEEIAKKAPPQVQDALKDVKKRFGF